jgi:protoporphyrinogen/coproporphyrinogen III oxidase
VRVAVVGGGIAGLAAARRLEALDSAAEVVVVEPDSVLGGKVRTERVGGFVIEAAPDSFLSRKERGVGLCEELDLGGQLIGRRPENHRTYVRRGADLLPLPEGLTGMIPTNLDALERSALLSEEGRARFLAEPDAPVAPGDHDDESVAAFVTRRFGREAYDALVEPLMTGIYGGDGEQLSLRATFPQLRALELDHGSLLRALPAQPAPAARPPFVSLRDGLDVLVTTLVSHLERTRVVRAAAMAVRRAAGGFEVDIAVGGPARADGVVLATPAFVTAELLGRLDAELAEAHASIPYASSVVVTLAFSTDDVTPLDGYGYVIPRAEGGEMLACTWSSQKWEGRAPAGSALVRVYGGRFGGRDLTLETDEELVALARRELELLEVTAEPTLVRVQRWPLGMPQYVLGHPGRVARIEALVAQHPGLAVAGAAYRGVGIPDCVASGEAAAESVVEALSGARA